MSVAGLSRAICMIWCILYIYGENSNKKFKKIANTTGSCKLQYKHSRGVLHIETTIKIKIKIVQYIIIMIIRHERCWLLQYLRLNSPRRTTRHGRQRTNVYFHIHPAGVYNPYANTIRIIYNIIVGIFAHYPKCILYINFHIITVIIIIIYCIII